MALVASSAVTPRRRRSHGIVAPFVLGLAVLQAMWIVTVPPFRASDEFDHAYRAAAVARGEWVTDVPAENGRGGLVRVPADLVRAAHAQCDAMPYTGPDNCNAVPGSGSEETVLVASAAGGYHPAFYWVIGTAARPFDGAASLYAMRTAAAFLCLVFLGLAAWAIQVGARHSAIQRSRWHRAALVLALTPVFVFSTAVAAPNGLEIAAGAALWCSLLALPKVSDPVLVRRLIAVAAAAGVVMSTLRMLGPLFVLMIVGVVVLFHGRATLDFLRRSWRPLVPAVLVVGTSMMLAALWILASGQAEASQDPFLETTWSPTTLILWPLQTIAAFPYRNMAGPALVYPVVGGLVCALTLVALKDARGAPRLALGVGCATALLFPVVLTALTYSGQGVIWQGRYGLPFAVGFVIVAGMVLDRSQRRQPFVVLVAAGVALTAATVACLGKITRNELSRSVSSQDPAWMPLPMWLLIVGGIVAHAAWLMWVLGDRSSLRWVRRAG